MMSRRGRNQRGRRDSKKRTRIRVLGQRANRPVVDGTRVSTYDMLKLAMEQHQAGLFKQAKDLYEQVLKTEPNNSDALQLLGLLASNVGQYEIAEQLMRRSLAILPDQTAVWSNLGLVLFYRGNMAESESCCRRAVELDPAHAMAYVNLGNALQGQRKLVEAEKAYRRAVDLKSPLGSNNLGILLREQGRSEDEIEAYRNAVKLHPEYVEAWKNLGVALIESGRRGAGLECLERVLKLDSNDAETHRFVAVVRKYSSRDAHVATMEELYNKSGQGEKARMHLAFALGKVYEDLGDWESSYSYLEQGNRLRRGRFQYSSRETAALVQSITETFTEDAFANRVDSGIDAPTPIFVLGMPRSGTSLVEQILASHPEVYGAGELPYLPRLLWSRQREGGNSAYPLKPADLIREKLRELGDEYLRLVRRHCSSARYIVDKLPENFLHVGMIRLMLPGARIVHCRRDARATCWSIFKTFFTGHLPYAYDQRELGEYYRCYERLMQHWSRVLPGLMHEVEYEELVESQEHNTRLLLDYCGLGWEQACLDFHSTRRSVRTASAAQVHRPMYQTSVAAWKDYRAYLEPLIETLEG